MVLSRTVVVVVVVLSPRKDMSRPSTFFGALKRTVTTTHKKRMIRTIDDDAGAFLRRIARDVFSLSFCLSLSLFLSVFRIPNNTQRRERDDILERQNFRERRERRIELLGSPPFQNISPLFFVCTALFRVLHFCEKGKKNRQIFAPAATKRKKETGQPPSLRLEFSRHKSPLSLSLSAFITPPLEEGQPKAFFGGGRRRRRRRSSSSSSSFSIRREKKEERARKNSFCVVRVREDSNSNSGIKTISGDSHFSLAIISIERFGRVGTRSVRRETAVFFCAL